MSTSKRRTILTAGSGFLAGAVVVGALAGGLVLSHQTSNEITPDPAHAAAVADFGVAAKDCAAADSTFRQTLTAANNVGLGELSLLHTSTLADAVASLTGSVSYVPTCKVPTMAADTATIELQTQIMAITRSTVLQQSAVLDPLISPVQERVATAQKDAQESAIQAAIQVAASAQEAQRTAFCHDNPDNATAYCQGIPG